MSIKFSNSKYSAIQTDQELRPKWSQRSNLDNDDIRPQHDERQGPYKDPDRDGGDQIASWKTGFWTNLPVLAIASLVGVFACTSLAVGVLASSNGCAVQTWRFFTPSVCLAVLSAVSNALLAVALAEGLVISFWRKALHSCTLSELNRNWYCGYSLLQAVSAGFNRGGRVTSLACIFSALSLLRGPLNQRASSVDSNVRYGTQGNLELQVAQRLPHGYAGISVDSRTVLHETAMLTSEFTEIMNGYSSHSNMTLDHSECGESCTAIVKGFGFKVDCGLESTSITLNRTLGSILSLFTTSIELYKIAPNPDNGRTFFAGLQLNATFYEESKDEGSSSGQQGLYLLTSHTCKLQGGIVAYKVRLTGGTVSLFPRSEDEFLELVNLTSPGTYFHGSVIGGFQYAGDYLFSSQATEDFRGTVSSIRLGGSLANQMISNPSNTGSITFDDPMDTMLDAMREIAFRAALQAGKNNATVTSAQQSVPFTGHNTHTIYIMDTKYMVLGALVNLMGIITVGATFYGWWQLGRTVSMSPLEIAKAFDAPLLTEMGSNVTNERIPICVKSQRVQYGVGTVRKRRSTTFKDVQEIEHLILGPVDSVRSPVAGVAYT